jgi:hypothetical protein
MALGCRRRPGGRLGILVAGGVLCCCGVVGGVGWDWLTIERLCMIEPCERLAGFGSWCGRCC